MNLKESKINDINWNDEFKRFKNSGLNSFSSEYIDDFEYSDIHHKYSILPKSFDYGENNLSSFVPDVQRNSFEMLNFGWDMWCASLIEVRL